MRSSKEKLNFKFFWNNLKNNDRKDMASKTLLNDELNQNINKNHRDN